jgi:hypothetical protein
MRRPRQNPLTIFAAAFAAFAVFSRAQIKSLSLSSLLLLFSMIYAKNASPLNGLKAAKAAQIGLAAFNQKSRPSPIGQGAPRSSRKSRNEVRDSFRRPPEMMYPLRLKRSESYSYRRRDRPLPRPAGPRSI